MRRSSKNPTAKERWEAGHSLISWIVSGDMEYTASKLGETAPGSTQPICCCAETSEKVKRTSQRRGEARVGSNGAASPSARSGEM